MKLLLLYGSPAVGKLTVANEIAKQTDFKVFHNHLSIDCVLPVFDFGTKPFFRLISLIRLETISEATRAGQNLIFTFCYAKDEDDELVEQTVKAVEENGGEVCLVLLKAEKETIEKRILEESRKQFHKVKSLEILHEMFDKYELFAPVNNYESLIVDNTHLSAGETAQKIINHFNLTVKKT